MHALGVSRGTRGRQCPFGIVTLLTHMRDGVVRKSARGDRTRAAAGAQLLQPGVGAAERHVFRIQISTIGAVAGPLLGIQAEDAGVPEAQRHAAVVQ